MPTELLYMVKTLGPYENKDFFFELLLVLTVHYIYGNYRGTIFPLPPPVFHTWLNTTALDVQRLRLEPTGAPDLDRPLHGRVDPAVIEEIRLVLPNCIRLGGPQDKNYF